MCNECIILNKAFEGSWNGKDGNVSHEIIDFFKADNDKYYVYNSPYGSCRNDIFVNLKEDKCKCNANNKYQAQYLIIASNAEINTNTSNEKWKSRFKIKYLIKLKSKLTSLSATKDIKNKQDEYKKLVKDISYGNENLFDIFKDNEILWPLVTFEAEKIFVPKTTTIEIETTDYKYQRNRGYIFSDTHYNDFHKITKIITETSNWEELPLKKIDTSSNNEKQQNKKTFLNLILKTQSEECYTNILYSIFKYENCFTEFLEFLRSKNNLNFYDKNDNKITNSNTINNVIENNSYNVYREYFVISKNQEDENGRMDICAISNCCRIFIENKVLSGLNGKTNKGTSQLTIYRDWCKESDYYSCLILVPDYRKDEIEKEISYYEEKNKAYFTLITYSTIVNFLNDLQKKPDYFDKYEYKEYKGDFISIFNNHTQKSQLEKYTNDFLNLINKD